MLFHYTYVFISNDKFHNFINNFLFNLIFILIYLKSIFTFPSYANISLLIYSKLTINHCVNDLLNSYIMYTDKIFISFNVVYKI